MLLLIERILNAVERSPATPAFIAGGQAVAYRALLALLSNALGLFVEKGVRPGDTVALNMGQSPLHVVAFLALARLGAISLSLYPGVSASDRAQLFVRLGVRAMVSDSADAGGGDVPVIPLAHLWARGDEAKLDHVAFMPAADTPMRIGLTSGTTQAQKGFLMTHESFVRRLDRRFYGDLARPRAVPSGLHINASLQLACHALCAGGTVVFPRGNDAADFFSAMHLHAVTHIAFPPVILAYMVSLLPEDRPAFPSIEHLRVVGLTPSPALVDLVRRKITPNVFVTYSASEVGVVALATPDIVAAVPQSAGRVAPGARLEVFGEDGKPLPAGARGEIRVAADGMPTGYYGADAGAAGFRDGWFYPRDRGFVSADGFVFIEGRIDDILNLGGHKIAPEFLESLLLDHPGVREAAVFALEEGLGSTRLAVAVVPAGGLDWRRLANHARARFDAFAPALYFKVEALPRNPMGKLRRKELAAWVASHGESVPL